MDQSLQISKVPKVAGKQCHNEHNALDLGSTLFFKRIHDNENFYYSIIFQNSLSH